jgi:hypothetical protein
MMPSLSVGGRSRDICCELRSRKAATKKVEKMEKFLSEEATMQRPFRPLSFSSSSQCAIQLGWRKKVFWLDLVLS